MNCNKDHAKGASEARATTRRFDATPSGSGCWSSFAGLPKVGDGIGFFLPPECIVQCPATPKPPHNIICACSFVCIDTAQSRSTFRGPWIRRGGRNASSRFHA
mmetsp:Transcript_28086/g.74116  ORF Transcript_28086/g.74116 Transcript_28086/m.74116 type:complete len:103 (+) Transcript_28086:950-1258(+)